MKEAETGVTAVAPRKHAARVKDKNAESEEAIAVDESIAHQTAILPGGARKSKRPTAARREKKRSPA